MSADVIDLRIQQRRSEPDALAVEFDFGCWTVKFYQAGRFRYRRQYGCEADARAVAERLVEANGLSWHPGRRG